MKKLILETAARIYSEKKINELNNLDKNIIRIALENSFLAGYGFKEGELDNVDFCLGLKKNNFVE